jgi:hypothetical protein
VNCVTPHSEQPDGHTASHWNNFTDWGGADAVRRTTALELAMGGGKASAGAALSLVLGRTRWWLPRPLPLAVTLDTRAGQRPLCLR